MKECYVRGNTIKYIRVEEDVIQNVKDIQANDQQQHQQSSAFRGGRGGREIGRAHV